MSRAYEDWDEFGPRPGIKPDEMLTQWQFCWRAALARRDRDAVVDAMISSSMSLRIGETIFASGRDWLAAAQSVCCRRG